MKILRGYTTLLAAALVASVAPMAHATLLANVGISTSSSCQLSYNCSSQQFTSSTGYDFVYASGTVTAPGQYGNVTLGAPGSTGGNAYLALDSDFPNSGYTGGPALDTISNLQANHSYTVTFNWADDQQIGYPGPSDDEVQVCLDTQCFTTSDVVDSGTGVSTPWLSQSFTFQAPGIVSGNDVLSFLGIGGAYPGHNSNVPAFALVDDLSITDTTPTPEPSSLMLLGTGLAGLGGLVRSRFSKKA